MSVEDRARRVMAQVFGVDKNGIAPDASQENLARWDSLGHLNLCVALEEEFGISLRDTDVVEMTSLPGIVKVLSAQVRE